VGEHPSFVGCLRIINSAEKRFGVRSSQALDTPEATACGIDHLAVKFQYWRAFSGNIASKGAPMLEFHC
jgi:hypothetical protein